MYLIHTRSIIELFVQVHESNHEEGGKTVHTAEHTRYLCNWEGPRLGIRTDIPVNLRVDRHPYVPPMQTKVSGCQRREVIAGPSQRQGAGESLGTRAGQPIDLRFFIFPSGLSGINPL
jgi:hypothetical protein